ncbi:MAG: glutamate 5-kinase [Deltaproteobacteria bacterium]|nr:glutamate 5-kinase [Deltaproteobacteria bacterium]
MRQTDGEGARRGVLTGARTVVVKLGTGVLTGPTGGVDRGVWGALVDELAALAETRQVVVVSSGAIALGVEALGLASRPKAMDALQACAAVGQGVLIARWAEGFARHHRVVAQVLLTHADLASRKRWLNARRALAELVRRGAIAVINENDTVSFEEIAFGDNDNLSAQVANLCQADALVMLSVAPGLLDGDRVVPCVAPGDRAVDALIHRGTSAGGTGGMASKVAAARAATEVGCAAVIAPGKRPGVLGALFDGEDVGTVFLPGTTRKASRDHWIAHTLRPRGVVTVDRGARDAVRAGRSLLPSGITAVRGGFGEGDAVDLEGPGGELFARGLVAVSAQDLEKIRGRRTQEVPSLLGYDPGAEVLHADDLVLLGVPS